MICQYLIQSLRLIHVPGDVALEVETLKGRDSQDVMSGRDWVSWEPGLPPYSPTLWTPEALLLGALAVVIGEKKCMEFHSPLQTCDKNKQGCLGLLAPTFPWLTGKGAALFESKSLERRRINKAVRETGRASKREMGFYSPSWLVVMLYPQTLMNITIWKSIVTWYILPSVSC